MNWIDASQKYFYLVNEAVCVYSKYLIRIGLKNCKNYVNSVFFLKEILHSVQYLGETFVYQMTISAKVQYCKHA